MALKLIELWVINGNGLSYFHVQGKKVPDSKVTAFLFSGFLSAVQSMAAEAIDSIKMMDSKILIVPVKEPVRMFVVGRMSSKEKDENGRKVLYKVRDMFLTDFTSILPTWMGQEDIFDYFARRMEKEFIE